jgi:hypothetical protein
MLFPGTGRYETAVSYFNIYLITEIHAFLQRILHILKDPNLWITNRWAVLQNDLTPDLSISKN